MSATKEPTSGPLRADNITIAECTECGELNVIFLDEGGQALAFGSLPPMAAMMMAMQMCSWAASKGVGQDEAAEELETAIATATALDTKRKAH